MAKQAKRQLAGSGEALPAGVIGQKLTGTWLNPSAAVGTRNALSIDLPPGVWALYGKVYMQSSGATGYVELNCSVSTTSNTQDTESRLNAITSTTTQDIMCASLPKYLAVTGAPTTPVYFVVTVAVGGGSLAAGWVQGLSTFYAVRIA
jgi:hypothetical protein